MSHGRVTPPPSPFDLHCTVNGQAWGWGMSKTNMFGVPTVPGIRGIAKVMTATKLPVGKPGWPP